MADTAPDAGGGGGSFLTRKYMGIPAIVWVGGAALLAYMLFFRNSSGSSGSGTSSSGTATTGNITFSPPASDTSNSGLNPGQGMLSGGTNPQPTPAAPGTTTSQVTNPGSTGTLTWSTPAGTQTGTAQQFLQAFQSTGQNAGQIVQGGTGQKIPLQPGQSYTS